MKLAAARLVPGTFFVRLLSISLICCCDEWIGITTAHFNTANAFIISAPITPYNYKFHQRLQDDDDAFSLSKWHLNLKMASESWNENPSVQNLPIMDCLQDIRKSLEDRPNLLLEAPPGAGKTTIVPLALLSSEEEEQTKNIILVEPRRVAVRSAAFRMANLLQQRCGEAVGYAIRGEAKVSKETKITVMTDGVLLQKLRQDPELKGVDIVILDEFHERNVGSDTALALCRESQKLFRPDLQMIVMSATLLGQDGGDDDDKKLIRALGGSSECTIVQSKGRQYPIDILWSNKLAINNLLPLGIIMKDRKALVDIMCEAIEQGVKQAPNQGDVLAFLPGAAEIKRVINQLQQRGNLSLRSNNNNIQILPLYGALSKQEQDDVIFAPVSRQQQQRVIVSSPFSEASLTLEGVTCVVDSGLRREPRCDTDTGMPRLVTVRISKSSATQRAGRAGRVQDGLCLRIYGQSEFEDSFAQQCPPEIKSTDLSPTLLLLVNWGIGSKSEILQELSFVDAPDEASLDKAIQLLVDLKCLANPYETGDDDKLVITRRGQDIGQIPTHPRFATTFLENIDRPTQLAGAIAVAFLLDDEVASSGYNYQNRNNPNLASRVQQLFQQEQQQQQSSSGNHRRSQLTKYAARINNKAYSAVQSVINDDIPLVEVIQSLGVAMLPGFVDLVGERKGDASYGGSTYLLALGRSARLDNNRRDGDSTASNNDDAEYVIVLDTSTSDDGKARIRSYVSISNKQDLYPVATEQDIVFTVPSRGHEVRARRVMNVGSIELLSSPIETPSAEQIFQTLKQTICDLGGMESVLYQMLTPAKRELIDTLFARLQLAKHQLENIDDKIGDEDTWPDWIEDRQQLDPLIDPWLSGIRSLKEVDFYSILVSSLTSQQKNLLDQYYPDSIVAPDGSTLKLSYSPIMSSSEETGKVVVTAKAKLQQFFGTTQSPTVGLPMNPTRIGLELLSPSNKLVGQTHDLEFFWKETYPQIRSELRGRYAKHPWPENPLVAVATRQTNKQISRNTEKQDQSNDTNGSKTKKNKKQKRKRR